MNKPNLSLMMTRYDRTDPLFSGEVTIAGADLKVCPPPVQGDACYKPVYEQFDIAEMSLSWYLMARCRGEPLIALRIFPLRMFIQPYLFCREPSAIRGPEDLAGKRVGIQQYRIIVGLWTRGILKERHGVDYSTIQWVVHERLFAKCPWISRQLVDAFNQADRCCQIDYEYPKRLSHFSGAKRLFKQVGLFVDLRPEFLDSLRVFLDFGGTFGAQ